MKPKNINKDYSAVIKMDIDFEIMHQIPSFRVVIDSFLRDKEILLIGTTRDMLVVKHSNPVDGWDSAEYKLDLPYKELGWSFIVDYGHQRYYWNDRQYEKKEFQIYCDKCGKTDTCYKYNEKFLCVKCRQEKIEWN